MGCAVLGRSAKWPGSVCLSVMLDNVKNLLSKVLCDTWTESAKAWCFIRTVRPLELLLFVGSAETLGGKDLIFFFTAGKTEENRLESLIDSHIPSFSQELLLPITESSQKGRAEAVHQSPPYKLSKRQRAPYGGAPTSEPTAGHSSRLPASVGDKSVTAGNEEERAASCLKSCLQKRSSGKGYRSPICTLLVSHSPISLSGHLCCLPVCLLAECLLNYLPGWLN